MLFAITTAGVILLTGVGYWRGHEDDPGLTTEIALIVTTLLGGLSTKPLTSGRFGSDRRLFACSPVGPPSLCALCNYAR